MITNTIKNTNKTISYIWDVTEINYFANSWCIDPKIIYNSILETGSNDVRYLYQYLKTQGHIVPSKTLLRKIKKLVPAMF